MPAKVTALAPVVTVVQHIQPKSGQAIVQALLDNGASTWVADTDRLVLLQLVADAIDERNHLLELVAGLPDAWGLGRYTPAALVRLAAVEKQLTAWLSLLGLTPTDRSRLGVAEVKARTRLEELRVRRSDRSRAG